MADATNSPSAENDTPEPTALAWTPDEEMERGTEEFKRLWPEKWEAWLRWCAEQDNAAPRPIPPATTAEESK